MKFKKLGALILGAILTVGIAAGVGLSSEGQRVDATSNGNYVKVTSAPSDWSGDYLIVYEAGKVAFNGGLTTLDAVSNTISITISDNEIAATDATNAAQFTINASGHIKSASGYYIGQTSNANGLKSSNSTTYTNTISMNGDGTVNLVSEGAYLRYNATSGQYRFRYYKSSSYTSQKAICLYKYEESTTDSETPAATLSSLSISGELTKTEYYVGDSWDPSGLTVIGHYTDEDRDVTDQVNWTYNPANPSDLEVGNHSLEITASLDDKEITVTRDIEILEATFDILNRDLTGVTGTSYVDWSGKTNNMRVVYAGNSAGDNDSIQLRSTNPSGIVVTGNETSNIVNKIIVSWNSNTADGRTLDIYGKNTPYSSSTNLYDSDTRGTFLGSIIKGTSTELIIEGNYKYIGLRSASNAMYLEEIQIHYTELTVNSIAVTNEPTKTTYSVGEEFDTTGMIVTATYSNNSTNDVTGECSYSPRTISEDTTSITISYTYEGKTVQTTQDITIKGVTDVTGINNMPTLYVGDEINPSDFILDVLYNDETTGTVQADSVTGINTAIAGTYTAIATYDGASHNKSFEFEFEVLTDGIKSFNWDGRSKIDCFEGTKLSEATNCDEWDFTITYDSGLVIKPKFGTGDDDVHVSLYDTTTPTEEGELLTPDYKFKAEDNGKYYIACYKGRFYTNSDYIYSVSITRLLNNITKPEIESDELNPTTSISAGDTVYLVCNTQSVQLNEISTTNTKYGLTQGYEDSVSADTYPLAVEEGYTEGTYSFKTKDGKYLTWTSGNSLNVTGTKSTNASWKVTFDESGNATIKNAQDETRLLKYNSSSPRFACYTSGQTAVQLYKAGNIPAVEYANNNLVAQKAVLEFVTFFNKTMRADGACGDGTNVDYESASFVAAWNSVKAKYEDLITNLDAPDKEHANNMLVYATPYWANEFDNKPDPLQEAMRTYDKVVSNSELAKFITGRPKVEDNSVGLLGIVQENSSMTIVIIALAALSAFAFVYVAKRKQRKIEL